MPTKKSVTLTTPRCTEFIEYEISTTTLYHLPLEDADKLTQLELGSINNQTKREKISFCLRDDDLIKSVEILNPKEIYPDWREKTAAVYTEISRKHARQFNIDNELLHIYPAKPHETLNRDAVKQRFTEKGMFVKEWYVNSPTEMATDLSQSLTMDELVQTNSSIFAAREGREWSYDFDNHLAEKRMMIADEPDLLVRTQYTLANDGSYIPDYIYIEEKQKTKNPSVCFRKISVMQFSNIEKNGVPLNNQAESLNSMGIVHNNIDKPFAASVKKSVTLSPNPSTDELKIVSSWQQSAEDSFIREVLITDGQGKTVLSQKRLTPESELVLNIENLPNGVYFVRCTLSDGTSYAEKFIKI